MEIGILMGDLHTFAFAQFLDRARQLLHRTAQPLFDDQRGCKSRKKCRGHQERIDGHGARHDVGKGGEGESELRGGIPLAAHDDGIEHGDGRVRGLIEGIGADLIDDRYPHFRGG